MTFILKISINIVIKNIIFLIILNKISETYFDSIILKTHKFKKLTYLIFYRISVNKYY